MKKREWPFLGDSPVVRARKMTGAYRQIAEDLRAQREQLRELLAEVNPKLLLFDNSDLAARIAAALEGDGPNPVRDLDERFYSWGEEWHAPAKTSYDPDDMVNSEVAGSLLGLKSASISRLRMRGRIKGYWTGGKGTGKSGHYQYRVGDLFALSSERRGREGHATDKVSEQEDVRADDR